VSASFAGQLRSNRTPIAIAPPGPDTLSFRVQAAELWDAVGVTARADTPMAEVKQRVIQSFYPAHEYDDDFILKLRGWEVLDERASVADSGVQPDSIILLAHRRRRAVR
jgi:hypothetical protein